MTQPENETDLVKVYIARSEKPLAELRAKTVAEISEIKQGINRDGVAIGISPTDKMIQEYERGEITNIICKLFKRMRVRGSDGTLCPITPLTLDLVGEYSPKHRWHYHGIIKVQDIIILDKIKRKLNIMVGRTVTEQIRNTEDYVNYMFKQYECPDHWTYYPWDSKECYIHIHK